MQIADALKILCGVPLRPRITTIDVWQGGIRQIDAPTRDPECPCCVRREFPYLDASRRSPLQLCGRNAVQVEGRPLDLRELAARLGKAGEVRFNEYALRFFASPYELTIFADGRAIVKGTDDPGVARSVYARYMG
jgi:molybdopterin-synthase adenylyltransferase